MGYHDSFLSGGRMYTCVEDEDNDNDMMFFRD